MVDLWLRTIQETWVDVWGRFVVAYPNVLGAVLILLVGWLVAWAVIYIVDQVLRGIKLPVLFESLRLEEVVKRSEVVKTDLTGLITLAVKWLLYIAVFFAALKTLDLPEVSAFFNSILLYAGQVVAGSAIAIVGFYLAWFLSRVVSGVLKAGSLPHHALAGSITRLAIQAFTVIAVLVQLGVPDSFLTTLFTGLVAFLAIALGLSFGLGGQSQAKDALQKIIGSFED